MRPSANPCSGQKPVDGLRRIWSSGVRWSTIKQPGTQQRRCHLTTKALLAACSARSWSSARNVSRSPLLMAAHTSLQRSHT